MFMVFCLIPVNTNSWRISHFQTLEYNFALCDFIFPRNHALVCLSRSI